MNLPITVTQNDLLEILLNVAPVRPVFIWGAPGIGKSSLVEQFAEEIGLGLALGAIASYATSKDVPFVRVVFCDVDAYDAGYMSPEDIAGCVKVTGFGGTILQPAVNLIEKADNFPANGPILIITDGYIEERLKVTHEHAYLLPKGNKLPFTPKGKVFYFKEMI